MAPDKSRAPLSQNDVRVGNALRVLENVRSSGVASRARIASETGLTVTTVHRLTADLRRRGLLTSTGLSDKGTVGRPAAQFRFNAHAGYVVGIDVGNETTRAVLATLDGTPLASTSRATLAAAPDLVATVESVLIDLQRAANDPPDTIVGVAIGIAAVATEGKIVQASLHHLWEGLQLGTQLRRDLRCDVLVAQDDHLAARAELQRGACVGLRNAVVLNIGKGIGAGIIADGAVYSGYHMAAGRLGWIPLLSDGALATRARLAQVITADGLVADFRRFGGTAPAVGAVDVFRAGASGDPAAARAIDLFADRLGSLIGAVVAVMDPQRVVIGGGISGSYDRLHDRVTQRLSEIVPLPPPVVPSTLGARAVVEGAVDAALQLGNDWLTRRISSVRRAPLRPPRAISTVSEPAVAGAVALMEPFENA